MSRIGISGTPLCCAGMKTHEMVGELKGIGLDTSELQFTRGVYLNEEKAELVGEAAKKAGVLLSVHAPYFINLASSEKATIKASIKRIEDSLRIGNIFGATCAVFHPAYYGKLSTGDAYDLVKTALEEITGFIKKNNIKTKMALETTGRQAQFGTLDETIDMCNENGLQDYVIPCVDFAHLHARSDGHCGKKKDFDAIFDALEKKLGKKRTKNLHCHFSQIAYAKGNEKHHLVWEEGDMDYKGLAEVVTERVYDNMTFICESPVLEIDALKFMEYFK